MSYLLDTGILLRLADQSDAQHETVHRAVRLLIAAREELLITTQNMAEFCNVATRPIANNGLGLTSVEAIKLLEDDIEPICAVIAETEEVYASLKRLIGKYSVTGKQVHDARLVAVMLTWHVDTILTLNERNFRRFQPEGITIITPGSIAASNP
jgi:predicted nucleic acid-binding protein